ncbi:MAG: acyltransferase [Planctomycetota bacterium]|jgi:NDP-sugar pyrophosphorylase family protein
MSFAVADFFDLTNFEHAAVFDGCDRVWDVLKNIAPYVRERAEMKVDGVVEEGAHIIGNVMIGEGTVVRSGAYIQGPAIIGKNCDIRPCAYFRGDTLLGDNCIVGNSTELKNTLLLDGAMAPHYNYCGDSVLGNDVNLGAGTKLSNWKIAADKTVRLRHGDEVIDTGLNKFGALLGDGCQTGCNAVMNPGTVLGRNVLVYACAALRGYVPHNTIVKLRQNHDFAELS